MKLHFGLAAVLAFAGIAGACGSTPPPETPTTPTASPDEGPAPSGPAPEGTGTAATPETPKPAAGTPSQPLVPSKMLEDVKKLGVDLAKSPDLAKMPLDKKKKLMPLFQKALGFEACTGCHAEGDMKAKTRNREIGSGCWKTFVQPLRDEKGGPIFCDSCHNGKAKFLNRSDVEAVKKFMEDEYEHKLTRADKKETECATCHGEAVELKIFDKLWKAPAK
jgi:hypothetical protein